MLLPTCHFNKNVLIKIQKFSTFLATFSYYLKSFNAEGLCQNMTSDPTEISNLTYILPFQPRLWWQNRSAENSGEKYVEIY